MVKSIAAQFPLPHDNRIVLYRPPLPQRYVLRLPDIEVSIDDQPDSDRPLRNQGNLGYDHQGLPTSFLKRGKVLDGYF